jgi:hypothetical protein
VTFTQRSPLITHAACAECGGAMMLSAIEPVAAGIDKRVFRCTICDYEDSITVRVDQTPRVP